MMIGSICLPHESLGQDEFRLVDHAILIRIHHIEDHSTFLLKLAIAHIRHHLITLFRK